MKIIVIEAQGLHLGYLGCYGNDWVATPNLDRLATEGVVFDWHIADQPELHSDTPWAQRSVATGNYAFVGPSAIMPRLLRCESLTTFARDVRDALDGSDRWLWIEGPNLLPPWNLEEDLLDIYFDDDDIEEGLAPWIDPPLERVELDDADVLQLQSTYAAVVTFFDAQLGVVIEQLRAANQLDDVLLCVTARSGLPLGEHAMIGTPYPLLHDELVHVPLVMRLPHGKEAGLRIGALTQPVDLFATFLEALNEPIPPTHGQSLWPLVRGEVEAIRPYAVSMLCVDRRETWLLRSLDWAFHRPIARPDVEAPGPPNLFVKPEDRWEVNNLYQQQIETADEMTKVLDAFAAAIQQPGPLRYPMP